MENGRNKALAPNQLEEIKVKTWMEKEKRKRNKETKQSNSGVIVSQ